jgi:hypothetical protein
MYKSITISVQNFMIENECSGTHAKIKPLLLSTHFLNVFFSDRINIIARSVKTTLGFGSSRRGDEGPRALHRGAGVKRNRDQSIRDEPIGDESIRDEPVGDEPSGARDDTVTSQVTTKS